MRFNKTTTFIVCFFCVGLWLLTGHSEVRGARVAGEEDVTPTAPGTKQGVQEPTKVKPPQRAPVRREPAGGKKETIQKKAAGEKVKPSPRVPTRRKSAEAKEETVQKKAAAGGKKAPKEPKEETRYITIDFDDVDIRLFVKFISELTGKNFVIDKGVKGTVTIISPTKITIDEAYKVFESVLEVHGYTTVPAGSITKIIPAVQARSKDIETRLQKEAITPQDKVVTQLVPLRYADPNEVKKLFTPMISKSSVIVSYPPTGMLIVTDVLSNIKRLLEITDAIDVEGIGEEISVVPLEHATASVMAKFLTDLFQKKIRKLKKGVFEGSIIRIVSDERTNVLIILASEDDTEKIKQLIKLLDKVTPRGEGDIHVIYLQNANAEDLAKVLMALPSKQAKAPKKGKAPVISKEVQIVADKATNSLVITAKKDDFVVLEDVIGKLDIARRMVYIEALLMEVSTSKKFEVGVEWQAAQPFGSIDGRDVAVFGSSFGGEKFIPQASGFSFGVLGDTITIGGVPFFSLGAVVKAFQSDSDVRILSTPQILTTDNEEAEITVGKNVPYVTSRQQPTTTGTDYSNYEYRDVGVTLKLTPQINQEKLVRLKVSQEVTQLADQTLTDRPTTFKRLAKTTVIVKDGNTVVIGGLIDETSSKGQYMVPCLGGVPGLGWLFKSVSSSGGATNLYVFLTPRIIENPSEAKEVYEEKKGEIDRIREGAIKMYKKPGGDVLKPEVKGEQ